MDVKKTIAELTSQLSEINYDSEEDNLLLRDSKNEGLFQTSINEEDCSDVEPSQLRKTNESILLTEPLYGGKTTTRKKSYSLVDFPNEKDLKDNSDESSIDNDDKGSGSKSGDDITSGVEDEESSEVEESSTVLSKSLSNSQKSNYKIYSSENKSIPPDTKKGSAIRNQLRIWESLLEGRIKLQKALVACNSLPARENLMSQKAQMSPENKLNMNKCNRSLLSLLEKMIDLQRELLQKCQEYSKYSTEQNFDELNEEIESSESESERDEEKEEEEMELPRKKRKLNDYAALIKDSHSKFIPYRNASIQKWNDKTKVSSGKMANSNFSAFDQSTLKQIEQIMADKVRLVNRTRIRKTDSQGDNAKESQDGAMDAEIFDDTDFYHKLLRDYIERKSVDVTSSTHSERQMIELQKLRSKMKKSVDTKSTKGRKLRYVVLPKLVNFMAPHPYNTWSEQAENELYSSLFGKIKVK